MKSRELSPDQRGWCKPGITRYACLLLGIALLSGCATSSQLYDWGRYQGSLEQRYEREDSAQAEQMVREQMAAYGGSQRVPPGVYADYGFLLFRRGDTAGALAFFEKEKRAFPESTILMDRLIDRIKKKTSPEAEPAPLETEGGEP